MKRLIAIFGIVLVAFLASAMPVSADTPHPDADPPGPVAIDIYRNILETGDMLVLFEANLAYAVTPDDTIVETFSWSFRDGGTLFGATSGFAYQETHSDPSFADVDASAAIPSVIFAF